MRPVIRNQKVIPNPARPVTSGAKKMKTKSHQEATTCCNCGTSTKLLWLALSLAIHTQPLLASTPATATATSTSQQSAADTLTESFFAASHRRAQPRADGHGRVIEQLVRESLEGELPELTASHNPADAVQLKAVENFLYRSDEMHGVYSVSDLGLMALVTRAQGMVYGDLYTHSYHSHADMRRAAGPQVDHELCVAQLEELANRTERQLVEKYQSKDLQLYRLFDTWGRVPSGLLLGNVFFEGAHDECLRLRLRMAAGTPEAPTRYCVLIAKHTDWPRIDKHDLFNLKAGICIPKACDSSNYKNKFQLIMRMARYQYRQLEMDQVAFNGLYCLPDEDSPLRSIVQHPLSLLTLVVLCLWLAALLFASWQYHKLALANDAAAGQPGEGAAAEGSADSGQSFGLTNMSGKAQPELGAVSARTKVYQVLSIGNNLRLLFDTTKESSLMETGERLKSAAAGAGRDAANPAEPPQPRPREKCVDLRCIEGIKVIAMVYVIMGHVLMCLPTLTANPKELVMSGSAAFFLVNLVPAFAVNAFFTITGLLTCYLMFKQHQSFAFITSPGKWVAFILYRYLRIMPMYALAVLYCKHLARFAGRGPLWDYSTSALGQRRACEQESWLWTLTFTSNFLPPMQHCIPGGWYLSNDFQFFLATPVFLALLCKRPRLGRGLLYAGVATGYLASFLSIFNSDVEDLRPIARFEPHGFKTYVSHFSFNYTRPQYRIPAYLIGLLVGHKLHLFEQARLSTAGDPPAAGWSDRFKRHATPVCALLVGLCCATPLIGARIPFSKPAAKFMVALITPTYHVLFASAVGIYLLLATTGHGSRRLNRLLAAPLWKPLARLSLCAVLVNVETINFIVQGHSNLHSVSHQFHVALNCLCILATYFAATLVCVLFEAPIRGSLNAALTLAIAKVAAANKESRSGPKRKTV